MVVQEEEQDDADLGGPHAAATLDEIANAAESTRPQLDDMFSPRSSAAMTLTSIAMQPPPPQQALFASSETAEASTAAGLPKTFSNDPLDFAEEDQDEYFLDARQAFQPPREGLARRSRNAQQSRSFISDDTGSSSKPAKIRRISVGNPSTDENAPSFTAENRSEPTLPPLQPDRFHPIPFSTNSQSYGGSNNSILVSSYTIGPCAFSVTRPNPPPATLADFLPPPWTTPSWGPQHPRRPVYLVPNSSYPAVPKGNPRTQPSKPYAYRPPVHSNRTKRSEPKLAVTPTPQKKADIAPDIPLSSKLSSLKPLPVARPPPKIKRQTKKTLGNLAEAFIELYETNDCQDRIIVIDDLAKALEVERRRIYDVVNILESLQIVIKVGKNTYGWMGRDHLEKHFAIQQNEAIHTWPNHAVSNGVIATIDGIPDPNDSEDAGKEANKSLTRLSQQFLHVFLVGFTTVNLPQASDIIQGMSSSEYDLAVLGSSGKPVPVDPKRFSQAAAKGLKTKIRRLYDVANVFLAIGLLRRTEDRSAATVEGKRPHFHWNYSAGVTEFRETYDGLPDPMKSEANPFYPEDGKAILEATRS